MHIFGAFFISNALLKFSLLNIQSCKELCLIILGIFQGMKESKLLSLDQSLPYALF